jgi:condensin complex subunit 1
MSFLLNFIKKERQAEMIVEKLCHRFPKCTSISQKANISHCLAHVKINEKCIKILNDHFNLYKDALFDEDVLRNFLSIVTKTKKFAKPELKEALEEWETKLKLQADMGLEDEEANRKAEHTKKRVTRHSEQKEIEEESGNGSESIEEEDDGGDSDDEMEFDQEGDENLVPTTNTPDRNKGRIVPPRKLCQKRDALSSLN